MRSNSPLLTAMAAFASAMSIERGHTFETARGIYPDRRWCGMTKTSPSHAAQKRAAKKRRNIKARASERK